MPLISTHEKEWQADLSKSVERQVYIVSSGPMRIFLKTNNSK